ncbi:MAG TPA: hypothetical protein VM638_05735, partial [Actinomycetota bacterium]|nr:hypothetical protein [Actinomycetota bacterium]
MRGSFLRRVFTVTVAGAIWMVGLGAVPAGAHPEAHCEKEASTTSSLGAQLLEELVAGSHNDCTAEGIDVSESTGGALGEPVEEAVEGDSFGGAYEWSANMEPIGFSKRHVPTSGTGANLYNSDLAFWGDLAFQGTYAGFRIIDISDPTDPVQLVNYTDCASSAGQGDLVVWEHLLIRSWDAPASTSATCGGQPVGSGFEGIHIFDISNPSNPVFIRGLRMASNTTPAGCGSHTATAVPDPARGNLYLYVGGSSSSCTGMDIVRISMSDPQFAVYLRRASASRQCHDNNVIMGDVNLAVCAGGNGFSVFSFDPSIDPEAVGGLANPRLLYSMPVSGVSIGHSASFSYDGSILIFGHEPGGGSQAQCQSTSSVTNRTIYFFEPRTGAALGSYVHPRPQSAQENCTWHNFNVVPSDHGHVFVSGNYQSGILVVDFTNPATPHLVAHADPARLGTGSGITLGGDWSTYWYDGLIYESDIRRGLIVWKLEDDEGRPLVGRARTFGRSNPQTQDVTFSWDRTAPRIDIASPVDGASYAAGSEVVADYDCTDEQGGSGVVSCEGTAADGEALDTSSPGEYTFTVEASDLAGNTTTRSVTY